MDSHPLSIEAYRRPAGTTIMLLNGEPFISFVPTTVYTGTFFSGSMLQFSYLSDQPCRIPRLR
jgi:hypothetical protein